MKDMKLPGMLKYVKDNLKTFDDVPFNSLDALVLTWLSYINYPKEEPDLYNFQGVGIRDLLKTEYFELMFNIPVQPDMTKELFLNICFSPRFRNIKIANYVNKIEGSENLQFSAITLKINPKLIFVAYRGTDATFVGWKEDFLLSIDKPIPSEIFGQQYLSCVLHNLDGDVIVSGHSKGGTVAVYSAVSNNDLLKDRLVNIYSFDGPGFRNEFLQRSDFLELQPKMTKLIPQSSMIGTLFNHECDVQIVHSNAIGFIQHDPFTWEINENDFIYQEKITPQAKFVYTSALELVEKLNDEEKLIVINAIFGILEQSGAISFTGFTKVLLENISYFANAFKNLPEETRKVILNTIKNLATICLDNIPETIRKFANDVKKDKI